MHRLLVLGILFVTGCANTVGPLEHFRDRTRVDDPYLSISEQQQRGRDRLARPDPDPNVAPPTNIDAPGPHGR
jgi:hypothetical protein